MNGKKNIIVYAHWSDFDEPTRMGILTATPAKGKEIFSFEYDKEWLKSGFSQVIDPELQFHPGLYYPREDKTNFGVFLDSCPDRWGRVLMDRREEILARKEKRSSKSLLESDYLLGVYDGHRMGGLRFKLHEDGPFLNSDQQMATPPWTYLRELENASLNFEADQEKGEDNLKWINLLIAPGSSLGGARPKASVVDPKGNLWIAKFPSINDRKDVGAWEMVANRLALESGMNISEGSIKKFASKHHTYLTKRFDRGENSTRIHFASAMTMLGYTDSADNKANASYIEIAEFLIRNGADVASDLNELWRRIVFSIAIRNTDDHLRNHGFLLTPGGWRLSPAYDVNPNEYGTGLSLNISEKDNSLDFELALSVAEYFSLNASQAKEIIEQVKSVVAHWRRYADEFGISRSEQDRMGGAFEAVG